MNSKSKSPLSFGAFRRDASEHWSQLNPRYIRSGDSIDQVLVNSARETLPGFFAPLRMAGWLLRYRFSAANQGKKK